MIHQLEEPTNGQTAATAPIGTGEALRPLRGDTLAIVGFSETTRGDAPYGDPNAEIWICNRLGLQEGITRWDRHFDPHPLDWSQINHKPEDWRTYSEWLVQDFGEGLVYLPKIDPETLVVPSAVIFPKEEVIAGVGDRKYFASAIGWQLGLALLLHQMYGSPKRIELYGIDLRGQQEYEYQRPNAEWLLGIAQGRGIEIYLPDESALLNQDGREPLYGVELYSGFMGSMEKAVELRVKEINAEMEKLRQQNEKIFAELRTWDGARQESIHWHTRVTQFRRGGKL